MSDHNLSEEEGFEEEYLQEEDQAEEVPCLDQGEPMDDEEDQDDEEPEDSLVDEQPAEDEMFADDSVQGFFEHDKPVYAIDIHPDNLLVASGGEDNLGYLWRIDNGERVLKLDGHTDSISSIAFSSTGKYVATGGMDGKVRFWEVETNELKCVVDGPDEIVWIDWHPKGNVLLAGASDSTVWMWLMPSGQFMNIFNGHAAPVTSGCFTPDGKCIVTVSEDKSLIVWDPKSATAIHRLSGELDARFHAEPITSVAVNNTSSLAISGSLDGKVRLINITSGVIVAALDNHTDSVETACFCDVLPLAATGSVDGTVTIWDVQTQKLRHTLSHKDAVVKVKFVHESYMLVSCSVDRTVKVWDARTGECVSTREGHMDAILSMGVSKNGKYIVTGSDDGHCLVYNA